MKLFSHSGHLGDVIYSLPAVKILSAGEGAVMYIKEVFEDGRGHINGNLGHENEAYTQYDALKDLVLQQSYISEVRPFPCIGDFGPGIWPGLKIDYDLDYSRRQPGSVKRYTFHVERYFLAFNIGVDWRSCVPWLEIDDENKRKENFAIFQITYDNRPESPMNERWNGYLRNDGWKKEYQKALTQHDKVYFTGYIKDYEKFCEKYNVIADFLPTNNLLDLARVIRDCQALYCNQNVSVTLAQGMKKKYFLARNGDRTHCHTLMENEVIL